MTVIEKKTEPIHSNQSAIIEGLKIIIYHIYQPLCSGKIWHKVNLYGV